MILPLPQHLSTLPGLLVARSRQSTSGLSFLDASGTLRKKLSYADLFYEANLCAHRLIAAGLKRGGRIVLASFEETESHIILFWACCLAGIVMCPLPPFHPDPARRKMLLEHLQSLFKGPVLVTSKKTSEHVQALLPGFSTLVYEELPATDGSEDTASVFPANRPHPEDPVCLMLTSGSTGQPKAVVLCHSQLLSSSRGKATLHLTSHQSCFLNWIAFDHVAAVSEIHIHALLVNAKQYHISPAAIVRSPRLLLELSSKLQISYTFSPNFLLAQILRDVSATPIQEDLNLSRFRALISGGEAVPLQTAVSFADLLERYGAPRNALRAGFGMSETGAGSIYGTYPIPRDASAGGYLSVGKNCFGLSMRIMRADTTLCGPGEAGQLQISGPSVFEEYFRNPSATADAFTADGWFDTGDLGMIDSDGNLNLVGRDKDCLNINGVKLATADVEHYVLSAKVEGVHADGVFVCPLRLRDADTETYVVFYRHCDAEDADVATHHTRMLSTNAAIKNACRTLVSQAPHVVLPLPHERFVKTSLGKVSRAQLARAYSSGEFAEIEQQLQDAVLQVDKGMPGLTSPLERIVVEAVSTLFNVDPAVIGRSTNVFDMGASSMHLMRLKTALEEQLGLGELPTMDLLTRPEVGELCEYLAPLIAAKDAHIDSEAPKKSTYQPLVRFASGGSKPPVFFVHPGVGEVLVFINLARVLAADRPVYAIRARGFDVADEPFGSLEEMVETYVGALEATWPSGPFFLAGYSYGGAVAFEIGKALEARGRTVAWLGILNLPPHIQFRMRELSWTEVLLNLAMFLALVPSDTLPELRVALAENFPEVASRDEVPEDPRPPLRWLLERSDDNRRAELAVTENGLVRWSALAYAINLTGREFFPAGAVRGALTTVFCAVPLPSMGTREEFKRDRLSAWADFAGRGFEMVDVDGEHYTMLGEDHVDSFAAHMRGALERAEALSKSAEEI